MTNLTRAETARFLQERDDYLILTHRRPDGDTLGSGAVLCRILRAMGKRAAILENPEISPKYRQLHQGLTQSEPREGQTVVSVDTASVGLLPPAHQNLGDKVVLRIDHHATATPYATFELVDGTAGACGEILYDILKLLGLPMDKDMAEALYTAVSTDTGGFRYANTTAHSFLTAAACAQAGGDIYAINQAIFDTTTLAKVKMQSWIVEHMRFQHGGKVAVCAIPRAVEQELGVTEDDMENISGFPRSIEGVLLAATLRETGDGRVKVSVRAVPGYDAAAICQRFGGGGHKGAAGATLDLPLEEAARAVSRAMPK